MKWRRLLAGAALVAACGEPALEPTTTSAVETTVVSTVEPSASTTTVPAEDPTTTQAPDELTPDELLELFESAGATVTRPSLPAGEEIASPTGFPPLADLAVWAGEEFYEGEPRALITSYLGPLGDPVELIAGGMMAEAAIGTTVTITYYDGVIVWDFDGGGREVWVPGGGTMVLGSDGEWSEGTGFEWPAFFPIVGQTEAQLLAAGVLRSVDEPVENVETEVVGYETLADVATVRVKVTGSETVEVWVTGSETVEVWVTANATVMRFLWFTGDPTDPATVAYIWNVETLNPTLTQPLPPGI